MKKKLATTALLLLTAINTHARTIQTIIPKGTNFSLEPHDFFEKTFPQKNYTVKVWYLKNPLYSNDSKEHAPTLISSQLIHPKIEITFKTYDNQTHYYEAELFIQPKIYFFRTDHLDGNKGKEISANVVFTDNKSNKLIIHGVMVKTAQTKSLTSKANDYFYMDYNPLNQIGVVVLRDIPITIETT